MFFTCGVCSGQNLVPNPSFEDTLYCPTTVGGSNDSCALNWWSFRQSPDYFNTCADSASYVHVPNSGFGYQVPYDGNAYYGMQTFFTTNYREIIGCQLISPLVIGTKYYVSFQTVRASKAFPFGVGGASNKMGLRFSTVSYNYLNEIPINNFAHIYTDTIITDTLNWFTIRDSIIADSAYQYLAIGNLFDDANTDTIAGRSYYWVDAVCVTTDSAGCVFPSGIHQPINNLEVEVYPNPFSELINMKINNNQFSEILLYDILSRQLLQRTFINSVSINTEQLAKGIYLYEVRNKNGVIKKGKIVKD